MATRWQANSRLGGSKTTIIDGLDKLLGDDRSKKLMRGFVDLLIQRWQSSILRLKIGHEGNLSDSFTKTVKGSTTSIHGRARFNWYGRMVDMGVGKGVTYAEQSTGMAATRSRIGGSKKRKPKPWYMDVWVYERHRLGEVYRDTFADELLKATTEGLTK